MVNKSVFKTGTRNNAKVIVNQGGGKAYAVSDEHALCQLVVTNCFNDKYYSTSEELLAEVKKLTDKVSPTLLAKAAVYGQEQGRMKDMPAYLLAVLAAKGELELLRRVFPRVTVNAKMLCNFVQIIRSGVTGRKSFGTAIKTLIQNWLNNRSADRLFDDAVGHANPSLSDIIKMVHPKGIDAQHNAMFAYLIGKDCDWYALPERVRHYELFKKGGEGTVPSVDFRLLSNLTLSDKNWEEVARNMRWDTLRRNLNTIGRHGVLKNAEIVKELADKLSDKETILKVKAFPYELLTTYLHAEDLPKRLKDALHDAVEHSVNNIPDFNTKTALCIDVSGSMSDPVTGHRGTATSKMTCVQLAGLMASAIIRKNSEDTKVLPFCTRVHSNINIDSRDSVLTNAQKLAINGGGTDCAVAMAELNRSGYKGDLVIYISDNQSNAQYQMSGWNASTNLNSEWKKFKARNPKAKLVLIDIAPYTNTQVSDDKSVLNVAGFNDAYFGVIDRFVKGERIDFVKAVNEVVL